MAMQVNIFIDLLVYFENVGKHSSVQAVLFLKLEKYKKMHLVSFRKVVEHQLNVLCLKVWGLAVENFDIL